MSNADVHTIFIALLDEGAPVWRPVEAIAVGDQIYQIISRNPSPDDEQWEFTNGEIVRCVSRVLSGGLQVLVAVASATKNFLVVDGAANSTFDVFSTNEATFSIVFPNGSDVAFLDEVAERIEGLGIDEVEFFGRLYSNRRDKKALKGCMEFFIPHAAHAIELISRTGGKRTSRGVNSAI